MATGEQLLVNRAGTPLRDQDVENKLEVAIYNLLSVGEWEAARGQLLALSKLDDGRKKAKDILKSIILHPKGFWNYSLSVPSVDHLALLALQTYLELFPENADEIPSALENKFKFHLLLYATRKCNGYTAQICEWLKGYYNSYIMGASSLSIIPLHTFDNNIKTFLRSVLMASPSLAHTLILYLTIRESPRFSNYLHNNEILQTLYIECIDVYWSKLEKLYSVENNEEKDNLIDKIHLMLSLIDPQPEMSRLLTRLDNLLVKLLQSTIKNDGSLVFTFESIYSCFIGRALPTLIQRLQDIEYHICSRVDKSEGIAVIERWKDEFYKCVKERQHFLERTMDIGLKFISSGQLDQLFKLVQDSTYTHLKPLLLLIGWDRYSDIGSGQKLLSTLWSHSQITDPLLYSGCCKLAFQVGLVQWCLQKAKPFLPANSTSVPSSAGDVFQGLKTHSVLYVLHHSTPLSTLDPLEVIDILKVSPDSSLSTPSQSSETPSSFVRSVANSSLTTLQPEQERDINTFRGFCCLKLIQVAIWSSVLLENGLHPDTRIDYIQKSTSDKPQAARKLNLEPSIVEVSEVETPPTTRPSYDQVYSKEVSERFAKARSHLSEIFPLHFRLEILENIFSLLFLSSDDISIPDDAKDQSPKIDSLHSSTSSNGSNRTEQDSPVLSSVNSTVFIKKQKGFLLSERTASELIVLLNDCMFELTAAKFSLHSSPAKDKEHHITLSNGVILSSISPSFLQQRSTKLQKQINEAKWRLELVSSKSGISSNVESSQWGMSSGEESISDTSDHEEDKREAGSPAMPLRKTRSKDLLLQEASSRNSPKLPRPQHGGVDSRQFGNKSRSGSDISRRSNSERVVTPSTDDIYESSGHCADIEEPLSLSLANKKKKARTRLGSTSLKNKKSKYPLMHKGTGIIYHMLASPNSLLCKCLRHKNYHKAREVIKMFNMEDTVGKSLVRFSEQFEIVSKDLVVQLDVSASPRDRASPLTTEASEPMALQKAVLMASNKNPALESLHRLLVPTNLSKMLFAGNEELDQSCLDTPLLTSLSENVPSLVMLDLLISNDAKGQIAKKVINMAVSRSKTALECLPSKIADSHVSGRRRFQDGQEKPLQGPLNLLHTLSEVSGYFIVSVPDSLFLSIDSPHVLFTRYLFPLSIDGIQNLKEFNDTYQEKRNMVESLVSQSSSNKDILVLLSQGAVEGSKKGEGLVFNELSHSMSLFPYNSTAAVQVPSIRYIHYLNAYLSKFVNLLRNSLNLPPAEVCSNQMLSVLHESPTNLIGRLVFEKSISPQRLEQFMSDLPHLKIVEVIVKCCCPNIPSIVLSPIQMSTIVTDENIIALNAPDMVNLVASNGTLAASDESDPCQLSHKLLNKMITTLKGLPQSNNGSHINVQDLLAAAKTTEMRKIFACTSKLASISLDSLQNEESKQIAFFSNVTNLLYAHSLMVLAQETLENKSYIGGITVNVLQSDKVAQTAYFSRVGYIIGELGLVSLYDLHYSILRRGLSIPVLDKNSKLSIRVHIGSQDPWVPNVPSQSDPRVLYVISNGTISYPVPRLLLPEHIHSELDTFETKYLRNNVTFDVNKFTIKIPKLLDEHRDDFIPRKNRYKPGNPFRYLSNLALARYICSKLPKEQAEQLTQLVDSCDMNRTKRNNELIIEVMDDNLTIGYDFPSTRRTSSLSEGASPQLSHRQQQASPKKHSRRYEKLKPYMFTEETMSFVKEQAPLLASIVSLLCPPKHLTENVSPLDMQATDSNELLDSIPYPIQQQPQEETKKAFIQTFHFRRSTKPRQVPEVKRSLSITDESKIVFPRPSPVWQDTFDKLLELFDNGPPLRNYFSVRAECFKCILPWDSSIQESTGDSADEEHSINLRKLIMLSRNSVDLAHACSFVLRKFLRHGLIHEALQFLRSEPMINNVESVQYVSNLVCSAGIISEMQLQKDAGTGSHKDEISQIYQIDPLVLIHCHDDKESMARLVLSYLDVWSVKTCVDLLMYINCHLPSRSLFLPLINKRLQQLHVYQKIIELVEGNESQSHWVHWSGLLRDSWESEEKVLKILLKHKEFNLAREWNKVHKNSFEIIAQIEEEYIYNLLESIDEQDPYTAQSVLEDLPLQSMKQQVCENLLERCFNLESLMLILQFLLGKLSFQIPSHEKIKQLTNQFLGVKSLLALPHFIRDQYRPLMREPLLIIEQLLIDLKIEWAGKVIKELSNDEYISEIDSKDTPLIDQSISNIETTNPFIPLLMFYSEKALEFPLPKKVNIYSRAGSPSIPPTPFSRPYERVRSPSQSSSIPPTPNRHKRNVSGDKAKYHYFEPPPHPPKKEDWKTDSKYCQVCNSTHFGMFSRRHHCRRCGRVACGSCSAYFLSVEGYDRQQRVCSDCYNYHALICGSSDEHVLPDQEDRMTSPPYFSSQFPWQLLPGDSLYNQNLRTEFYYNGTPSTPLCLAIIDLMSDLKMAAKFILHCCHNVSLQLVPDEHGFINEEIDHYFTISIMENLLLNAKLRFVHAEDSSGVELCDTYLSRVDLLRLLVSSSYSEIPSIQELTRPELARRVRDKLIADDRYELAIEVSTKCQLDPVTVWTAWGMACIKAGEFKMARDKFRHSLQGGNQSSGGGTYLLERIIEQLLSCPLASVKSSDEWSELIRHTLALSEQHLDNTFVNSRRFSECVYYLRNYGTVGFIIGFFSQHQCWLLACQEANNKQCSEEVFVNQLWLPALKLGQLDQLEECLSKVDPSLVSWERYLTAVCRFLSQRKLFHILYRMQIFMKDYVRAAMTCIKFYIGFSGRDTTIEDLYSRKKYLFTAQEHFQAAIEARQPKGKKFAAGRQVEEPGRGSTRSMSIQDLQTHIHTICLQLKVTDLLYKAATIDNTLKKPLPVASSSANQEGGAQPATLFSTGHVRGEVTCHMLVSCQEITEGFQTAYEMISLYHLPPSRVFTDVARLLATKEHYTDLRLLIQYIQKSSLASDELNDEICMSAIKVLANQTKEARAMDKNLDKLISMLTSNKNKIKGLIQCGKLKNAYLVAIKSKLPEEVEHIADVAAKAGQLTVRDICEKWLQQYRSNKLS